jgi:hypothetical protein
MKAISFNAIITGIRAKIDGSLGLTISTPELSPEEKVEIMKLQNHNLEALLKPLDEEPEDMILVDKDLDTKTQSQRIRSVLYVLYNQTDKSKKFEDFYYEKTEKIIDWLKEKIDN